MLEGAWPGAGNGGVEHASPARVAPARAEAEVDHLVVRVQENCKSLAGDAFAVITDFVDLVARQPHAEAAGVAGIPIGIAHLELPSGLIQ